MGSGLNPVIYEVRKWHEETLPQNILCTYATLSESLSLRNAFLCIQKGVWTLGVSFQVERTLTSSFVSLWCAVLCLLHH